MNRMTFQWLFRRKDGNARALSFYFRACQQRFGIIQFNFLFSAMSDSSWLSSAFFSGIDKDSRRKRDKDDIATSKVCSARSISAYVRRYRPYWRRPVLVHFFSWLNQHSGHQTIHRGGHIISIFGTISMGAVMLVLTGKNKSARATIMAILRNFDCRWKMFLCGEEMLPFFCKSWSAKNGWVRLH